jgi:hypothetical protein
MEDTIHPLWILHGFGAESLFVVPRDATPEEGLEPLAPFYILSLLGRWALAPENRAVLVDIYVTHVRPLGIHPFDDELLADVVLPALRGAFEREELIVLAEPRECGASSTIPAEIPPTERPKTSPPRRPPKTWVEIALVDAENRPMPGVAFIVTLPGGQRVHGRLDPNGTARLNDTDPGNCDVVFPDLDGREWGPWPFTGSPARG